MSCAVRRRRVQRGPGQAEVPALEVKLPPAHTNEFQAMPVCGSPQPFRLDPRGSSFNLQTRETVPVLMRPYAKPTPACAAGPLALRELPAMRRSSCTAADRGTQRALGQRRQPLASELKQALVAGPNVPNGAFERGALTRQEITGPNPGPRRKPECRRS